LERVQDMASNADESERLACSIEALSENEQRELIVHLTDYASFLIRSYSHFMPRGQVPRGYDAPGLAIESIRRVLNGRRRDWDPDKEPSILAYLKSVVKSIMSSEILPAAKRGKPEISAVTEDGTDLVELAAASNPGPAEEAEVEELKERILDGFELDEDQMVLMCLFEGILAPAAIAAETGLDQQDIYRIKQKIKRRLVGLQEEG
jgi:hypothetical protein